MADTTIRLKAAAGSAPARPSASLSRRVFASRAYQVAVSAPEALSAAPCYCGCGVSQGHLSLKDCYLQSDGSYTDHASNCHLCVAEALDVGKWHAEGVSLKEIRSRIDQKYSEYGAPTNTPPVS